MEPGNPNGIDSLDKKKINQSEFWSSRNVSINKLTGGLQPYKIWIVKKLKISELVLWFNLWFLKIHWSVE